MPAPTPGSIPPPTLTLVSGPVPTAPPRAALPLRKKSSSPLCSSPAIHSDALAALVTLSYAEAADSSPRLLMSPHERPEWMCDERCERAAK